MILLKNEAVVLYLLLPRTVGSAHNRGDLNFRFTLYAEGVRSSNAHTSYAGNLLLIPYTCDTCDTQGFQSLTQPYSSSPKLKRRLAWKFASAAASGPFFQLDLLF